MPNNIKYAPSLESPFIASIRVLCRYVIENISVPILLSYFVIFLFIFSILPKELSFNI